MLFFTGSGKKPFDVCSKRRSGSSKGTNKRISWKKLFTWTRKCTVKIAFKQWSVIPAPSPAGRSWQHFAASAAAERLLRLKLLASLRKDWKQSALVCRWCSFHFTRKQVACFGCVLGPFSIRQSSCRSFSSLRCRTALSVSSSAISAQESDGRCALERAGAREWGL